jgi:hypothetical protein
MNRILLLVVLGCALISLTFCCASASKPITAPKPVSSPVDEMLETFCGSLCAKDGGTAMGIHVEKQRRLLVCQCVKVTDLQPEPPKPPESL